MMTREVHVRWNNEANVQVGVSGDLSEAAIADLIKIIELMDGDEEYEPGMILDYRELRP